MKLQVLACVINCTLMDLATSTECANSGGIKIAYWTERSNIDFAAMAANAAQFDQANQTILGYTMLGGATWNKIEFDRETAFYTFTWTEDTDLYDLLITMIFEGKSAAQRNAFCSFVRCCDIQLHIIDNNCIERSVGMDWDGTAFNKPFKTLRPTRHLDASGVIGTDKPRDELDLGGRSDCAPLVADIGQATFEATYL